MKAATWSSAICLILLVLTAQTVLADQVGSSVCSQDYYVEEFSSYDGGDAPGDTFTTPNGITFDAVGSHDCHLPIHQIEEKANVGNMLYLDAVGTDISYSKDWDMLAFDYIATVDIRVTTYDDNGTAIDQLDFQPADEIETASICKDLRGCADGVEEVRVEGLGCGDIWIGSVQVWE